MRNAPLDLERFPENGCAAIGQIIDPVACRALRAWIDERRPMRSSLFYQTPEEFRRLGRWRNYAPGRTDHNLLVEQKPDLDFLEKNPDFQRVAESLCGKDYQIFKKSVIRSTPRWAVPQWILEYVSEVGRPNLNPFIRDEYQDVQFFLGTDYHQDKTRPDSNFVTAYFYLDDVNPQFSALHILRGSHKMGMTVYPHNLRRANTDKSKWFYSDDIGNHMNCDDIVVTGEPGSLFLFHCMTLHATGYSDSENPRISLRYLLSKGPASGDDTLLDRANRHVFGPQRMLRTRLDVAEDGSFIQTGSAYQSQAG